MKIKVISVICAVLTLLISEVTVADTSVAKFIAVSRQGGTSTNELYRYTVTGPNGSANLERTITSPNITNAYGLALSEAGEMYVSNSYATPSIARLLDSAGSVTDNGKISIAGMTPDGMVIRNGLLYAADETKGVQIISLDASGGGTLIGTISDHLTTHWQRGVTINPAGTELLVTECCGIDSVVRYTLSSPGVATFKDVIIGNGLNNPHDLVFSPWGELFVANAGNDSISRFNFDSNGDVVPNGQLTGNGLSGTLGLDFSPWGELFAASHFSPTISRWTFGDDALHTATSNGSFTTPNTMADLMFIPSIPEPETYAMFLAGLGLLGFMAGRRKELIMYSNFD